MGATVSEIFPTPEECDRWARQQSETAARWRLQSTADLGNTAIVRVPVIRPDGSRAELAVALEPEHNVDQRIAATLARRRRGYREDRSRWRQRAFVRSLRFD
jgi:hypothetical protein